MGPSPGAARRAWVMPGRMHGQLSPVAMECCSLPCEAYASCRILVLSCGHLLASATRWCLGVSMLWWSGGGRRWSSSIGAEWFLRCFMSPPTESNPVRTVEFSWVSASFCSKGGVAMFSHFFLAMWIFPCTGEPGLQLNVLCSFFYFFFTPFIFLFSECLCCVPLLFLLSSFLSSLLIMQCLLFFLVHTLFFHFDSSPNVSAF